MARVDLERATDLIASAIEVMRTRDQLAVPPELAGERARNAVQSIVAEFELRPRDGGPLLLAIGADQVGRLDVFADAAGADVEVARLTLYAPAATLALTADEARALVDGLGAVKGVR